MKKAALKKYGLNFCSKKAPDKTDASCCNIQFFICIPSDLVLLAQAHQQPNADPSQSNVYFPELAYNYHDRFLYPILHLNVHKNLLPKKIEFHTHYTDTPNRSSSTLLLPNGQLLPLQEHLQPKLFP